MIDYDSETGPVDIPGVPEDTQYLADRLDRIAQSLENIENAAVRDERPAPGMFFVMPLRNDFPQNVKTRAKTIIISVSAACTFTLKIGSAVFLQLDFVGAASQEFSFPTTIDAGIDVVATVSAGTLRAAVITGFPESNV